MNLANATMQEPREESKLLAEDLPTREDVTEHIADQLIKTSSEGPSVSLDDMLSQETKNTIN